MNGSFIEQTFKLRFRANPNLTVSWWFLRGIGLIYLAAFASISSQILGLIGSNGILPINDYLYHISQLFPEDKYWKFPTLFWVSCSDTSLQILSITGIAAACLVVFNFFTRAALIVCFALYLSIATAGQDFTSFQWDVLLLESGFLAIFLTWHSTTIVFLYRLLISRFMLMSGIVKLASGDPAWANLNALTYHYQTQPLPTPLAYYAYFLPSWWQTFCTAAVLFIELPVPFLVFMPRPFRLFAACCFILLQTSILLTGNYTFFNLLTLLLCLFLFDDCDLVKLTPAKLVNRIKQTYRAPGRIADACAGLWAALVLVVLATHLWIAQSHRHPVIPLQKLLQVASAFSLVNNYGPFAVMTTERDEIIVEGSLDGESWQEYRFKYKPDLSDKPLRWNIPHQPRLDWQLWFVPLSPKTPEDWFEKFLRRLQQGSPAVLALLADNPFPGKSPIFVRAQLYRFTFNSPETRAKTGLIWNRRLIKPF